MRWFRNFALALFLAYLAVFPGATLTVALGQVPAWGESLGGALLILQGAVVLCWLIATYGRRGGGAGLVVFLLAWGVEYIGVTTGFPFGRYSYTALLQPQLFGAVPLAIPCAWLMVGIGSWQLATTDDRRWTTDDRRFSVVVGGRWSVVRAATLVLLLDLQIETVATEINAYWVWRDHGPYYGVPTANFVAWWLVGLAIALVVAKLLTMPDEQHRGGVTDVQPVYAREIHWRDQCLFRNTHYALRWLPAALYLLSTLMFVAMNLARGYGLAGLVGVVVLLLAASRLAPRLGVFSLVQPRDATETE